MFRLVEAFKLHLLARCFFKNSLHSLIERLASGRGPTLRIRAQPELLRRVHQPPIAASIEMLAVP